MYGWGRFGYHDRTNVTRACINGRFLTRRPTGVDRYAREIVSELDKLTNKGDLTLVVPANVEPVSMLELHSIEVESFGVHKGQLWEQLDLAEYSRRTNREIVNLCNTAPFFRAGIVCIHDMNVRANPSFYSLAFRTWYRILFALITKSAKCIITVSDFSRKEIEKYYPVTKGNINVIPNAWQHMCDIEEDRSVLARNDLGRNSFYFAMSSLAPNKNLRWLVETARLNPQETIVVAGGINTKIFGEHKFPTADNVIYLGYITDGEAKSLMSTCKGFLFPTFYEGFGIPPLEALACGASVVVSDTKVMREVYGRCAHYVDPTTPCENLEELMRNEIESPKAVLSRFSWKKSALELLSTLSEQRDDSIISRGK